MTKNIYQVNFIIPKNQENWTPAGGHADDFIKKKKSTKANTAIYINKASTLNTFGLIQYFRNK